MRVLHLPYNIASQISVTVRALRAIGVEARGLVLNSAGLQDDLDVESHAIPRPLWRRPWQSGRGALRWLTAFRSAVRWADVIHWHYTLTNVPLDLDLRYIAALGKPRLVEFWGTDIRDPDRAAAGNPHLRKLLEDGESYVLSSGSSAAVQRAFSRAGFACLIPGPELSDYLRPDLFPSPIRTEAAVPVSGTVPFYPDPDNPRPLVGHMPSRPKVKGTEHVLDAVRRLSRDVCFEFRLIQNVPHPQALDMLRECDVVLDQFVIGSYGTVALEAMAMGKPVLCYVKPAYLSRLPPEFPVVNANPENLQDVLGELLKDGRRRHALGRRGRAYAEKFHDARVVAEQLAGVYRRLAKGRS